MALKPFQQLKKTRIIRIIYEQVLLIIGYLPISFFFSLVALDKAPVLINSFEHQLLQASCKLDKFDYNSIYYCDNIHNNKEV